MRRLMFSVLGVSAMAAIIGCETPTGPFKGEDGMPLTTASGAQIVVVDVPVNPPARSVSPNATMKERMKARAEAAAQPVQISKADAELAQNVYQDTEKGVLDSLTVWSSDYKGIKEIIVGSSGISVGRFVPHKFI